MECRNKWTAFDEGLVYGVNDVEEKQLLIQATRFCYVNMSVFDCSVLCL